MADGDDRVLMLIDDEPAQSRLICALASREGWRCVVAADTDAALEKLQTREGQAVAAILLDQWVPSSRSSGRCVPRPRS